MKQIVATAAEQVQRYRTFLLGGAIYQRQAAKRFINWLSGLKVSSGVQTG